MATKTAIDAFKDLAKEAGWSEDQVTLALSKPAFKELENGFIRQDEYSRSLDKARDLQAKVQEYNDWWSKTGPAVEGLRAKEVALARYQERFGDLENANPQHVQAVTGVSLDDVQKMLAQRDQNFSGLLKDGLRIASRHAAAFGEELDVDALEKIALEKRVPLTQAYEELVAPRVRERETAKTQAEIKRQVDEQVKDELSRRALSPGTSGHSAPPVFIGQQPTGADAPKPLGDQDLMGLWSEAGKSAAA